ncbi:MAG: hypothetical protein D6780_02835, partial [Candidatus Dadabacteria bacterium]
MNKKEKHPLVVDVVIAPLKQSFTYLKGESEVKAGDVVFIPLGKRIAKGFVITNPRKASKKEREKLALKPIKKVICSAFKEEQLPFFNWIADYYSVTLSEVLDTAVPAFSLTPLLKRIKLTQKGEATKTLSAAPKQSEILRFIKEEGGSTYQAIIKQRFLNCHSPLKAL